VTQECFRSGKLAYGKENGQHTVMLGDTKSGGKSTQFRPAVKTITNA
jgi:hypothetical protein